MSLRRTTAIVVIVALTALVAGCGAFQPDEDGARAASDALAELDGVEEVDFEQGGGIDRGFTTTYRVTMASDADVATIKHLLEKSVAITDPVKGATQLSLIREGREDVEIFSGYDDFRASGAEVSERFVAVSALEMPAGSTVVVQGARALVEVTSFEAIGEWVALLARDETMATHVGWSFTTSESPRALTVRDRAVDESVVELWGEVTDATTASPRLELYSLRTTLTSDGGRVEMTVTEESTTPSAEYDRARHEEVAGALVAAVGHLAVEHRLSLELRRWVESVDEGGGTTLLALDRGQIVPQPSLGWEQLVD